MDQQTRVYCIAHGILLNVMWQPGWKGSLGENGYMYMYGWVAMLYTWNYHNIVNWLLLLSHVSRVRLCATPETAAHQAPPSLGFSRKEHWSGLSFPSPMHKATLFSFVRFQLKYPPLTEIILDHLFHLITIIGEQINSYCNDLNTIGSYFRSYFTSIENLRQSCRL